jgi:hypothetical protein
MPEPFLDDVPRHARSQHQGCAGTAKAVDRDSGNVGRRYEFGKFSIADVVDVEQRPERVRGAPVPGPRPLPTASDATD